MTDTKNTQTAPAGLPAKEWFTLDEVAARWGTTIDSVLHLMETRQLEGMAQLPAIKSEEGDFISTGAMMYGIEPREAILIKLQGSVKTPDGQGVLTRETLAIMFEEVDRFEREYRIGKYAGTMPDLSSMGKWPWGNYETSLLKHLAEAAKELWTLYDPSEPSTAPTNEQVEKFLVDRGLSSSMAAKMATILRADGLPSGPRKG